MKGEYTIDKGVWDVFIWSFLFGVLVVGIPIGILIAAWWFTP